MKSSRIILAGVEPSLLRALENLLVNPLVTRTNKETIDITRRIKPDCIVVSDRITGCTPTELVSDLSNLGGLYTALVFLILMDKTDQSVTCALEAGATHVLSGSLSSDTLARLIVAPLKKNRLAESEDRVFPELGLSIDPRRLILRGGGGNIELTSTEFRIVEFLSRRPGWVFSRYEIVDAARGSDCMVTERTVDVHIASVRKKLGGLSFVIETVRGEGYRFIDACAQSSLAA